MRKVLGIVFIILFTGITNIYAQTIDKIAAVVGGTVILQSDIEKQYADYIAQGNPADSTIKCLILQRMITEKTLAQQAAIDSIVVTEDQIDNEVDRRMRIMVSRAGTQERLEQLLNQSILQYKDMIKPNIHEQLVAQKMQAKITEGLAVTPLEVKRFFDNIKKDSLPYINTEVEIGQIVAYPKLNEEEKKTFRDKAEALYTRVKAGEDFGTLARLYSQDPGSAIAGGDLGFMDRSQVVKEFAAMAFRLKAGEYSPVFESEFGFHILQVIERRGEQVHTRHILIKTEPTQASMDRAKAHIDSIYQSVAVDKKLPFSTAASMYSDDTDTKFNGGMMLNSEDVESRTTFIPTNKLDPQILFVVDPMAVNTYSKPDAFGNKISETEVKKGYRFFYLKSKTQPHQASLETDFPKIKTAALSNKTDKVMSEWFEKRRKSTYIRIDKEYQNCVVLKLWLTDPK
jgi:peptidyl-prolyl cis-trans isomerase SurA